MARAGGRRSTTRRAQGDKIPCPKFDPDLEDFEHWRDDVLVWRSITATKKTLQGGVLYLAIEGKAKQHVHNIKNKAILKTVDGFDAIIKILDEVYMPEVFEKKYGHFYNLFNKHRKTDEPLQSFVGDWHAKLQAYQSVAGDMSSETSAMMLIVAAKLAAEERQSVKLHVGREITYEKVREVIKIMSTETNKNEDKFDTLYNEPNYREEQEDDKAIRGHETLISRDANKFRGGNSRGRQGFRGNKFRQYRGRNNNKNERSFRNEDFRGVRERGIVRYARNGQIMKCYCCGSKYHLVRDCPESPTMKPKQEGRSEGDQDRKFSYNYFMVYMGGDDERELKTLMDECRGYAVLDCGCPHTVCGEKWIKDYIDNLSESDRKDIEITKSNQSFTFGDGRGIKSQRKMKIPVWMGGIQGTLTTDVVEAEIPLLLSINVMERAKMVLDFAREEIKVHGKYIRVKKMRSGHYAMPLSM